MGLFQVKFVLSFTKFKLYCLFLKKKSAQQSHRLHITGITVAGIAENT